MSTASDVKEGARTQWAGVAELVAEVPLASLYSGGLPGAPEPPYAQLVWTPGAKEFSSPVARDAPFIEHGTLTVKVWAAGSTSETAEDALGDLVALVQSALAVEEWALPHGTMLAVFPGEATQEEDGTFGGEPVWRADVPLELTIQQSDGNVSAGIVLAGYFPPHYF